MIRRTLTVLLVAVMLIGFVAVSEAGWDEGVAAFKSGKYDQAAKEFQAFVADRPDVFQGHYMLGQTLLKLGRRQEALTHLRKAFQLDSSNVGVQLVLGKAYLDLGRYADAAAILAKIDASSLPRSQQAALNQMLARALDKSGDSASALRHLAKAVQASPNDANAQYQYGRALLSAGETRRAVAALEKAARLDSRDVDKQTAYAKSLIRLGRESTGSTKQQAYQRAAAASEAAVALDPNYDNLLRLAESQLGAKQYDAALSTLQRAAGKNSGDWLPQFYMGQAYTQKNQFRSAESSLKQALDKTTTTKDRITVWKQLGFVYEKQKKFGDARAAYQRAGDSASVQRVEENQKTEEYNRKVEEENRKIQELAEEEAKIKEQLQKLPGGPPPNI